MFVTKEEYKDRLAQREKFKNKLHEQEVQKKKNDRIQKVATIITSILTLTVISIFVYWLIQQVFLA